MLSTSFFRDCREKCAKIHPIIPTSFGEECCICLSPLRKYKNIHMSLCAHQLHYKCVKSWLSMGHDTCPLCQGDQKKT